MKARWIVALVVVLLAIVTLRSRQRSAKDASPVTSEVALPGSVAPEAPAPVSLNPSIPANDPTPAHPPTLGPTPEAATLPGEPAIAALRDEIENVQFAVRDYRTAVGENPIGNNAEITRALMGDNLKQVKIPIPNGSSVNANGELCDRWGTPIFFHQISGNQMEIRSAGPDRELWTGDDVVAK